MAKLTGIVRGNKVKADSGRSHTISPKSKLGGLKLNGMAVEYEIVGLGKEIGDVRITRVIGPTSLSKTSLRKK